MNPLVNVLLCPSVLVTTTFTAPATWAAVVAVIELLLATFTLVAAVPPNVTLAPDRNPVPVMLIDVPPAVVPEVGEIALIVGAGVVVPCTANVATCIIQRDELLLAVAL